MSASSTSTTATPAPARLTAVVPGCIELLVLMLVIFLGWKARSAWPVVPLADPDTWGYINPALSWLSGLGFQQAGGRDWLYPAMVALFLKTTGSFTGILLWQRTLGLLSAVFMAITWRCWVSLLPLDRAGRFVVTVLGAAPIYVQLINHQNIFYEMSLRPESVVPIFLYAQLGCVVGYCRCRWQSPRPLPALILGSGAVVLAYACFLLKPSWYLAAALTSAPVFFGLFGKSLSLRSRLLTPFCGILLAFLSFWLPGRLLFVRDGASVTLLPLALFCVHSPLVEEALGVKLASLPDSAPEKAPLQHLQQALVSEVAAAQKAYRPYDVLRVNPDYLLDSIPLNSALAACAGADPQKVKAFCFRWYANAVLHDPGAYAHKVGAQFQYFVHPDPKTFFKENINLPGEYQLSAKSLTAHRPEQLAADIDATKRLYEGQLETEANTVKALESIHKHTALRNGLTPWTPRIELFFLVALATVVAWNALAPLRVAGWSAFFFFCAPLGNALGVCIVHALDIYRYRATYGGCLLFALSAMAVFGVVVVVRSVRAVLSSRAAHSSGAA